MSTSKITITKKEDLFKFINKFNSLHAEINLGVETTDLINCYGNPCGKIESIESAEIKIDLAGYTDLPQFDTCPLRGCDGVLEEISPRVNNLECPKCNSVFDCQFVMGLRCGRNKDRQGHE